MAAKTQLSPTALPGRRYTFVAKGAASGEHSGEFTNLSVIGVPGLRHGFIAKSPSGEHSGEFTNLSVIGVPGLRHSFIAKSPSVPVETSDRVTALTVMALPGPVRTFTAKEAAEIPEVPDTPTTEAKSSSGMLGIRPRHEEKRVDKHRQQILREDNEILEIIMSFVLGNNDE